MVSPFRLSTTKSLFPVQPVAVIIASRAAAMLSFYSIFFPFGREKLESFFVEKKMKKKSTQSSLFKIPGRSIGNRFFFRLALDLTPPPCPAVYLYTPTVTFAPTPTAVSLCLSALLESAHPSHSSLNPDQTTL